jgi:[glutamine synthetase] adenylyltransferase / [glutamine synthetase]-adenylyl-L-tyrosine phosphorylase
VSGPRHTCGVATLDAVIERSADPAASRLALERLTAANANSAKLLADEAALGAAFGAVTGASQPLTRLLETDPAALSVLAELDRRRHPVGETPDELRRWKQLEELRIAARDLLGLDPLEETVAALSTLAAEMLRTAHGLLVGAPPLAVIGMGKLGGVELNYASDIDVMFVGEGDPAELQRHAFHLLDLVRRSYRVDVNLRPEGRAGPLVRSLASFEAYWERWAEPWEFQALLKARALAGDAELGARFEQAAGRCVWSRTFSADDLRAMRNLKARSEAEVARRGLTDREVKRGRGGIRDIEFAVQLLQLVHGRLDPDLRSPSTLTALAELGAAGYVDEDDARHLADAYRFLRRLEHRLQLRAGTQVHAMPAADSDRAQIGRTLGFRDTATSSVVEQLDAELARHQGTVRAIHERLYFRPLLEAFAAEDEELLTRPGAVEARLSAFGFSDGTRTRAAVRELTRGFARASRLMHQLLPLLLGWLSESPNPDLGLLNVRNLFNDPHRAAELARAFRESPEAARRLCHLVGTTRLAADTFQRNPDLVIRLADRTRLVTRERADLVQSASLALGWREQLEERQRALRRWKDRHLLGVIARDVLHESPISDVGAGVTAIAEASLEAALAAFDSALPLAAIALGRFGGAELSYASDLDVVFVYEGKTAADFEEATRLVMALRRFVAGATPAERIWTVDLDLRPEGKQGPVARSIEAYAAYFRRWAHVWERQAMLRARPVAGDRGVAERFIELLDEFVWGPGLSDDDQREIRRTKARIEQERIPPGEDSAFHLKLGRGSLSDVEWTVQLLQLRSALPSTSTMGAIEVLGAAGVLSSADADVLQSAYRFCEVARNRLTLVAGAPLDALPPQGSELLLSLARSLGMTPSHLREDYRRVTRRARRVVDRLFYDR